MMTKQDKLVIILKKYEGLVDRSLGTWDMNPVEFELKEDAKTVCSRAHPVTNSEVMMLKNKFSV